MLIEGLIVAAGAVSIVTKEYMDRTAYKARKQVKEKLNDIFQEVGIKTKSDKHFVCGQVYKTDYGYSCFIIISNGLTHDQLMQHENVIKSNFAVEVIEFVQDDKNMIIKLITKKIDVDKYETIKCSPYELYCGFDALKHRTVDMRTYPHTLITGGSGTGKSRLLFILICNLLQRLDVELFMGQVSKRELNMFDSCRQVKYVATTLKKLLLMLKHVDKERIRREKLIGAMAKQGVFNLEDYNKFARIQLKPMYIILDELAFVMPTKVDPKKIRELKLKCLQILLNILRAGRSSGIFAIACLQQPDKESLPAYIKRLFQTKLCFKQPSKAASEIVLGDDRAYKIKNIRTLLVETNECFMVNTPYIDYKLIKETISKAEEKNHKLLNLSPKEKPKNEEIQKSIPQDPEATKKEIKKKDDGIIKRGA